MMHGGNVWQGGTPEGWLDFSANLRPEGPPEWVYQAMCAAIKDARYYPDILMTQARRGIAQYAGVPEDCVLPTSGGIAAIDAAIRAYTGRVLVSPPTFSEYALCARAAGLEVSEEGFDVLRPGDTLFLCNPNNPTGRMLARDTVLSIHTRALSARSRLIVDEAFIDCCPKHSVRDQAALLEGLVVVGSLTKALCIPGVRLGYLIARPEVVEEIGLAVPPWSLNAFAGLIAKRLPGHLPELEVDRARNASRRAKLEAALTALGASVYPSEASFLLCDFGKPMGEAVARLKDEDILVRTCTSFGLPSSFLRLAVKTEAQNARLIEALKGALL